MPGHSKLIIITTIITIIIMDYYHENLSSVAGILLLALHESSYFFFIILRDRGTNILDAIEREKTWKNLLALLIPGLWLWHCLFSLLFLLQNTCASPISLPYIFPLYKIEHLLPSSLWRTYMLSPCSLCKIKVVLFAVFNYFMFFPLCLSFLVHYNINP